MRSKSVWIASITMLTALALTGCQQQSTAMDRTGNESGAPDAASPAVKPGADQPAADAPVIWKDLDHVVAKLRPAAGSQVAGVVHFRGASGGVRVTAEIDGLDPGRSHGFHIHEFGDCTAEDASSAGGHYNPEGQQHGLPPTTPRHAGDLGNLRADENGHANFELLLDTITIAGGRNPVLGRGMIVHEAEDDGSQPTGAAGQEVACGVIGIASAGE
jgi:Cu-Zn family superoxide dismutase